VHTSLDDLSLVLGEISLFRGLPAGIVAEVARSAQVLSLTKSSRIYAAGERPRAFYHVMSGHLKAAVSSPEGDEKVIGILSPGQIFGVAELFGDASYVSSVETVTPVVLVAVGRDGVFRAMDKEPCVGRRMLGAVAERQSSIERDIAADCFQSGSAKVVDYLRCLAGCALDRSGSVVLELEIPKHVLAARLGFTPETLSRIFRELSDAGLIHVNGKQVTLNEKFSRLHGRQRAAERAAPAPGGQPAPKGGAWFERAVAGVPAASPATGFRWN